MPWGVQETVHLPTLSHCMPASAHGVVVKLCFSERPGDASLTRLLPLYAPFCLCTTGTCLSGLFTCARTQAGRGMVVFMGKMGRWECVGDSMCVSTASSLWW